jgi:hypothetical protein
MELSSFDAPWWDESNKLSFVFIQSVDNELFRFNDLFKEPKTSQKNGTILQFLILTGIRKLGEIILAKFNEFPFWISCITPTC